VDLREREPDELVTSLAGANGVTTGSPRITFGNFTIGGNAFYPRFGAQDNWSLRDNFTYSYDAQRSPRREAGADVGRDG
jgi:hypothetical protein